MRKHLIAPAIALALCACSANTSTEAPIPTDESSTEQPDPLPITTSPAVSEPPVEGTDTSLVPSTEPTVAPSASNETVGPIEVDSSALSSEVVSALRAGGGELATSQDWLQRFKIDGFPVLEGPSVHLVEATLQVSPIPTGWQRLDEMQWLFVASSTRDQRLDQLALHTGVTNWNRSETTSVVDSAECVVREYSSPDEAASWTLQGCEFPMFDNMVSIGVSRSIATSTQGAVPFLDPSASEVISDVDGDVAELLVTFGPPTTGSTSTLTMSLGITAEIDDPASVLDTGALASWNRDSGEAGTAIFAGAPGSYWTVIADDVRFTNQGRLAP